MVLEFSQYLEKYLWPNYGPDASHAHMMSVAVMLNEKFRERVQTWAALMEYKEHFPSFFSQALHATLDDGVSISEQTALIVFLNHCFNSMEVFIPFTQCIKFFNCRYVRY